MKIIVADDHTLFREGLRHILRRLAPEVEVLEADDYDAAAALLAAHPDADLALIDLGMPGRDRYPSLDALLPPGLTTPVVVLSASEEPHDIQRALDAGAMGYITKREKAEVMLGALRLVLAGGVYVPPTLLSATRPVRPQAELTPRQRDVLRCLHEGHPNKEIGRRLGMSESTVKAHAAAIFKALDVRNRAQALRAAQRLGLLPEG
jgi:Response regulator containing a CheY-like receiver domain and an HTH DNA-binding domain